MVSLRYSVWFQFEDVLIEEREEGEKGNGDGEYYKGKETKN